MFRKVKVKKTKRGFTLIETLLSVALLIIISTMMMKGFMSTINYSHNTSVYSKSAASNYADVISELGYYSTTAAGDKTTAYSALETDGTLGSLCFSTEVSGTKLILNTTNTLNVKVFSATDNSSDLTENLGLSTYAEDDDTYADNRYSFTYIPTKNKDGDGNHVGEIRIFRKNDDGSYWWGYRNSSGGIVPLGEV